jgi:hypothetical protein
MNKFLLAFCALIITTGVMAQKPVVPAQTIKFKEAKHDFGKIKQGTPVTYDFTFQNVSTKPVVIESATASCGCTTPAWPKEPVSKNKSEKVSAGFNAATAGPFDKTIFVKIAGVEQPMELKITGEVLNADDFAKYQSSSKDKKSTVKKSK